MTLDSARAVLVTFISAELRVCPGKFVTAANTNQRRHLLHKIVYVPLSCALAQTEIEQLVVHATPTTLRNVQVASGTST